MAAEHARNTQGLWVDYCQRRAIKPCGGMRQQQQHGDLGERDASADGNQKSASRKCDTHLEAMIALHQPNTTKQNAGAKFQNWKLVAGMYICTYVYFLIARECLSFALLS